MQIETRMCKGCLEILPLDEENFYKSSRQNPERPTKFEHRCKVCCKSQVKSRSRTIEGKLARRAYESTDQYRHNKALREKRYRQENPDGYKDSRLRSTFNITLSEYNDLLDKQGGGCAVCRAKPSDQKRSLHVDHDHSCCNGYRSCGKCVRGILCTKCNTAMGLANESIETLSSMIDYLRSNNGSKLGT